MVKNTIGLINNLQDDRFFKELTRKRTLASVPVLGKYRMIDFPLSSLVNSGVQKVGVMVNSRFASLSDHLRSGKEWGLDRFSGGLYMLSPSSHMSSSGYHGDLESLHENIDYLKKSRQDYVIITGSSVIANIDFTKALEAHIAKGADITVLYNCPKKSPDLQHFASLRLDDEGRITKMEAVPVTLDKSHMSLEMYIIGRELLISLTESAVAQGKYDLVTDLLIANVKKLKIYGYEYTGYAARIRTVYGYFMSNMEILNPEVGGGLLVDEHPIYTKIKNQAPTRYMQSAKVRNCGVANECRIAGEAENCVLSRNVTIEEGAFLKNCIVMEGCVIESGARLENVILDKQVHISKNKTLLGVSEYPVIVEKKTVL